MTAAIQTAYRAFKEQTMHYMIRAHQEIPNAPIDTPAAWYGKDEREAPQHWLYELSKQDCSEIASAVDSVKKRGLLQDEVTRDNFPLPTLTSKIQSWRQQLQTGRGFLVVRGLPVKSWEKDDTALAYWGLGHHLGIPGAQNPQQELLGHVTDYEETYDNPFVRLYRTNSNIDFHCDAADIVGLLCLQPAKSGGQSRIASSVTLFNETMQRKPHLIPRLFKPFKLDSRGEHKPGEPGYSEVTPCRFAEGQLRTFYHSEYMRSVERLAGVKQDEEASELLDLYDKTGASPDVHLDMWLEPGDMQFVCNHTIVHARTEYEDDPAQKRHLLRLWLSFE